MGSYIGEATGWNALARTYDVVEIRFEGFGRPLINPVRFVSSMGYQPIKVRSLT